MFVAVNQDGDAPVVVSIKLNFFLLMFWLAFIMSNITASQFFMKRNFLFCSKCSYMVLDLY